jgi:putative acetyltransferase
MAEIRPEQAQDIEAIREVNRQAFGRPAEAELVDALRAENDVTLSLVAVEEGQVVGHILFTPVELVEGEERFPAVGLGPMAVLPAYQQQGIGSRLIEAGLEALREQGQSLVFVLGHSDYYPRFGFRPTRPYGIRCEFDVPDDVFMVVTLRDGALSGRRGTVVYRPAFHNV